MRNVEIERSDPEPGSQASNNSELPVNLRPPWYERVRFWQAVAGMSVAVAMASLIVVYDLAGSRARLANYVNRRVAALNATVRTLRRQTLAEQRKIGSERERATVGEVFEKILFARDLRTFKLSPPNEKDKQKDKSTAQSTVAELPAGTLAMSETADAAMLEAGGLKPTGTFQVYRIWWMPKRGTPFWAADFLVGDDGAATVPLDLPPGRERKMFLSITLENESYSEEPAGPVALRAELSPLSGSAQSQRKSRR